MARRYTSAFRLALFSWLARPRFVPEMKVPEPLPSSHNSRPVARRMTRCYTYLLHYSRYSCVCKLTLEILCKYDTSRACEIRNRRQDKMQIKSYLKRQFPYFDNFRKNHFHFEYWVISWYIWQPRMIFSLFNFWKLKQNHTSKYITTSISTPFRTCYNQQAQPTNNSFIF